MCVRRRPMRRPSFDQWGLSAGAFKGRCSTSRGLTDFFTIMRIVWHERAAGAKTRIIKNAGGANNEVLIMGRSATTLLPIQSSDLFPWCSQIYLWFFLSLRSWQLLSDAAENSLLFALTSEHQDAAAFAFSPSCVWWIKSCSAVVCN